MNQKPMMTWIEYDQLRARLYHEELVKVEAEMARVAQELCAREGHTWAGGTESAWCIHCRVEHPRPAEMGDIEPGKWDGVACWVVAAIAVLWSVATVVLGAVIW